MIALRSSSFLHALAAGSVALALAGCGGAAPEAASPASKGPDVGGTKSEPGSIEEAQAEIAAARAQLTGESAATRFAPAPGAAPVSPGVSPSPSPPPPSSSPRPSAPSVADSASGSGAQDRCASPCRALASMRRAVGALCRMTGNDDARCADAKRTLVDSEGRVAPCSC